MLFNSISFVCFFSFIFIICWFILKNNLRIQNAFLLIASYYFYACWDWRFVFLLTFSTALDYYTGLKIFQASNPKRARFWLWISVGINLGFLGFFKYYNFFVESFALLLTSIGLKAHLTTLNIILPVGISFYTFHGMSYVFDIYNKKIVPTRNPVNYALFVSFFPLLVAGPIERATHLLPQVERPRRFNYNQTIDGLKQILWGFLKKVVIADSCAEYADMIFNNSDQYSGSTLILGAIMFAFQIYGDFSGYTDIALGTARLLGFELLRNFAFPYFSRDIAEFWRRWHISLSSWFRDYLYIPLGGSKRGIKITIRNTFIIFIVSGFWHGANWTFIVWGFINALYFMPLLVSNKTKSNLDTVAQGKIFPSFSDAFKVTATFALVTFAWIFFRAENMNHALQYVGGIFSNSLFKVPDILNDARGICTLLIFFICIEWAGRENKYAIENIANKWPRLLRWSFYGMIVFIILMFMKTEETPFIYFQF